MGIQLKLLFSESKDQLNIIVEDYDKASKKVLRTMLDVVVDLESKQSNISDIDECTNEDLNFNNNFSFTSNELEKVLGEELGIEISNITGNAVPFKEASSNDKSDSALAAVVSMAEKCTLSDKDEEEILNADFTKINVGKIVTNLDDSNLMRETNESDETMAEATVLDEDTVLNVTDTHGNNEMSENNSITTGNRLKNDDQCIPSTSSKNKDQSTPSSSSKQKQQSTPSTSATSKKPYSPSTSGTSSRKDIHEKSKSPKKVVNERSNSPEERRGSSQSEDDCEFVIEEVLDIDTLEEIDRWSEGDSVDKIVVDLTDRENIDPLSLRTHSIHSPYAGSCCGSDGIITVGNDFSDCEDEVCSQYSSARSSNRRRTKSDEGLRSFDGNFVPLRRARSDPPEDPSETVYDDDHEVQVVDLTSEKNIECVDLTNERKCENASVSPHHSIMIQRSPAEVMNDLRNFYTSNKEMIAAQKDSLLALAQKTDKKKSGIEAPPKLSNGLPYRKRCSPVTHESDIKFLRTTRPFSLRERNGNVADESCRGITPFNKDVPKPTCGPAGFRLNDDFGQPDAEHLREEEESAPRDPRYSNPIPNLCRWPRRPFSFRGNRRGGRIPSTSRNNRFQPRMQEKRFFKRYRQDHSSPLRRQRGTTKSSRSIQPTHFRGEVWLDLK